MLFSKRILILLALVLVSNLLISTSHAADETMMLEEVTVTAQRRAENLQDVPVSVAAISGEDIRAFNWDRPNDIAAQVANFQVSTPYGDVQPLFAIRGISMIDYTPSQSSPIGVYLDEGYLGFSSTHGMAMLDLQGVEVLRGPQGTLYGKNTTGGAINLNSRTPWIDDPASGYLTLGFGNYSTTKANGAIEGILIEGSLAVRFAFNYKKDDGYFENLLGGDDLAQTNYINARLTLNWEPTERFSTILKLSAGESDGRSTPPRIQATIGEGILPATINVAGRTSTERHRAAISKVGKTTIENTLGNLRMEYAADNFSIISVTSGYDADYNQVQDLDGTDATLIAIDWAATSKAWSQDLRFVSEFSGPFNFITGIYYGFEDTDTRILHAEMFGDPAVGPVLTMLGNAALAGGDPITGNHLLVLGQALPAFGMVDRRFDVEKESWAFYANFDYQITDRLKATVGVRYTDDKNTRDYINYSRLDQDGNPVGSWLPGNLLTPQFQALGFDAPFVTFALSQAVPLPAGMYLNGPYSLDSGEIRSVSEDELTWRLALDYLLTDNSMIYASYSTGFRSGSFNNGLVYADQKNENGAYAKPEFIDAFEAGFKSEFLDSRLRLNGAFFYYDYEDQQFVNQVGISAFLVNAGGVEMKGFELELLAAPTDGLTLQAGLGYLDSEYTELVLPMLSTINPLDTIDLKGNTPVSSPEINFNFAIDYEFTIADKVLTRLRFDGNFVDDQWYSAYNEFDGHQDIRQDAYWLFNGQVLFSDPGERYQLALWMRNIFDEEYSNYAINLQSGFGYNYFMDAAPRAYGVDFTIMY